MPTIKFDPKVTVAVSTISDGTMKRGGSVEPSVVDTLRHKFLQKNKMNSDNTVLVQLAYEGDDYCRYHEVNHTDAGAGIAHPAQLVSDGLLTRTQGLALFLPLADCIGVVLHDPVTSSLMLSHLGRHNLEQKGGQKSVEFMCEKTGASAQDIKVWLSPAAGPENYPLFSFNNHGMHEVAKEQLIDAGIQETHITASRIDTTKDHDYYSHSEFLKGHRNEDGRFTVVAMLK